MPLDQAVVLRHAGILEAGALGQEFLDIGLHIHVDLLLQLGEAAGQPEQVVVERRARGGEGEPVAPDPGKRRAGHRGNGVVVGRVRLHGIRIETDDPVPVVRGPAKVVEIEGYDCLVGTDRAHAQDVGFETQTVEKLHHALSVPHHVGLRRAGIVEIGKRDVAHALAAVLLLRVEVRHDRGGDRLFADRLAIPASRSYRLAEALDPIVDGFNLRLGRLRLAVELLVAVVRHLLLGDLDEELRAVRIAGQD